MLALDFRDMSALVRDTGTPANAFTGDPNDLLTYASPSTKWIRGAFPFRHPSREPERPRGAI